MLWCNYIFLFLDVPKEVLKGYKYEIAGTINDTGMYFEVLKVKNN